MENKEKISVKNNVIAVFELGHPTQLNSKELKNLFLRLDTKKIKGGQVSAAISEQFAKKKILNQKKSKNLLLGAFKGKLDNEILSTGKVLEKLEVIDDIYENNEKSFVSDVVQHTLINNIFFSQLGKITGFNKNVRKKRESEINFVQMIEDNVQLKRQFKKVTVYNRKEKLTMLGNALDPILKSTFGDKYKITKILKKEDNLGRPQLNP